MARTGNDGGPPDASDLEAFGVWLSGQQNEWSIVLATRAALRVLPFVKREKEIAATMLPAFRAAGISLFAAKYPGRAVERAAVG